MQAAAWGTRAEGKTRSEGSVLRDSVCLTSGKGETAEVETRPLLPGVRGGEAGTTTREPFGVMELSYAACGIGHANLYMC